MASACYTVLTRDRKHPEKSPAIELRAGIDLCQASPGKHDGGPSRAQDLDDRISECIRDMSRLGAKATDEELFTEHNARSLVRRKPSRISKSTTATLSPPRLDHISTNIMPVKRPDTPRPARPDIHESVEHGSEPSQRGRDLMPIYQDRSCTPSPASHTGASTVPSCTDIDAANTYNFTSFVHRKAQQSVPSFGPREHIQAPGAMLPPPSPTRITLQDLHPNPTDRLTMLSETIAPSLLLPTPPPIPDDADPSSLRIQKRRRKSAPLRPAPSAKAQVQSRHVTGFIGTEEKKRDEKDRRVTLSARRVSHKAKMKQQLRRKSMRVRDGVEVGVGG